MSRRLLAFVVSTIAVGALALATHPPGMLAQAWGTTSRGRHPPRLRDDVDDDALGSGTWSLVHGRGARAVGTVRRRVAHGAQHAARRPSALRKPAIRAFFNGGQMAITALASGMVFDLLGGRAALPVSVATAVLQRSAATALVMPFLGLCSRTSSSIARS